MDGLLDIMQWGRAHRLCLFFFSVLLQPFFWYHWRVFAYLLLFISFFVGERSMGRGIESCAENVRRFCHSKVRRPFVSFVCVFCVCVCVCFIQSFLGVAFYSRNISKGADGRIGRVQRSIRKRKVSGLLIGRGWTNQPIRSRCLEA